MKTNATPSRNTGTRNTFLGFLLMITLVSVLFLFAVGFQFVDAFSSLSYMFFQKLKKIFSFPSVYPSTSPSLEQPSLFTNLYAPRPSSYSMPMSEPDLEKGPITDETQTEDAEVVDYAMENDSSKDSESSCESSEILSETSEESVEEESEPDLEIQMAESVPQKKSLDMAIEKPSQKPIAPPKATFEEWQEPIPIDEEGISDDINGWCFIGQSKGARACAPVGKMDKCVTGELYANQMECLQLHSDDAVVPPPLYNYV